MEALILVAMIVVVLAMLVAGAVLIYFGLLGIRTKRTRIAYKRNEWEVEGDAAVAVGVVQLLAGLGFFFTGVYRGAVVLLALAG